MMNLADGWESYQSDVLKQGWPDDEKFKLLLELTFYAGALWTTMLLRNVGTDMNGIITELEEHADKAERMKRELKNE